MCVFAESVFIVCPETGMTEKLSKLELRGPQGFQVRNRYVNINISSEGGIIKLSTKGRSSWVVLLFVIKMNSFRGGGLLTYGLLVVGIAEVFLSCWGRGGIIVAYAYSFCQG